MQPVFGSQCRQHGERMARGEFLNVGMHLRGGKHPGPEAIEPASRRILRVQAVAWAGVDVHGNQPFGSGESVGNIELKTTGALLLAVSAEGQTARKIVLAVGYGSAKRRNSVAQDPGGAPQREKIQRGRRGRVQEGVERRIIARGSREFFTRGEKIAVQVDVVLIHPAKPRHTEGIQNVNQSDGAVGSQLWESFFQKLKLDRGAGEAFDAVQSGSVNERAARRRQTKPADIDGQIFFARAFRMEQDGFDLPGGG